MSSDHQYLIMCVYNISKCIPYKFSTSSSSAYKDMSFFLIVYVSTACHDFKLARRSQLSMRGTPQAIHHEKWEYGSFRSQPPVSVRKQLTLKTLSYENCSPVIFSAWYC